MNDETFLIRFFERQIESTGFEVLNVVSSFYALTPQEQGLALKTFAAQEKLRAEQALNDHDGKRAEIEAEIAFLDAKANDADVITP